MVPRSRHWNRRTTRSTRISTTSSKPYQRSRGTELGETLKHDGVENLTAMQEVVNRLSKAGSLEEALRIQMAFVHSQLNVWGKQATDLASLYTKAVKDAAKERSGG